MYIARDGRAIYLNAVGQLGITQPMGQTLNKNNRQRQRSETSIIITVSPDSKEKSAQHLELTITLRGANILEELYYNSADGSGSRAGCLAAYFWQLYVRSAVEESWSERDSLVVGIGWMRQSKQLLILLLPLSTCWQKREMQDTSTAAAAASK